MRRGLNASARSTNSSTDSSGVVSEVRLYPRTGKLAMPDRLLEIIDESDVELLQIAPHHVLHTALLPLHHGDPFDRLLIAQAQLEGLTLVTADPHFARYDVARA